MKNIFKPNFNTGLIFATVLLFIILIGFHIQGADLIGELFGIRSDPIVGNLTGLVIFFGIFGFFEGIRSNRNVEITEKIQIFPAIIAGATTGLIIGIYALIVGYLDQLNVDMRQYLAYLSRPAIRLLLYDSSPVVGSLINFGLFTGTTLIGSLLHQLWIQRDVTSLISRTYLKLSNQIQSVPVAQQVKENKRTRYIVYGVGIALLFIIPMFMGNYMNYTLGTIGIYVLMGLGLNIVVGLAGLLDLGYVAFFAIGAYTIGELTSPAPISFTTNFWIALLIGIILAALSGILLGIPVLRLRGDYLAIVTLGFGEIIRILIRSDLLSDVLGGPQGIRNISSPSLFGRVLASDRAYLYFIIIGIFLVAFITQRLQHSRVGRAWLAMNEDETVAQAMGINTLRYKLLAFSIGAAMAGLGGVLFAARNQYTGPEDHTLMVSINVLSLVIVGGIGSIPGVITGAFVLKGLPELLRQLNDYRILAFGALLVVMMIWRPEGIWPSKQRALEFHEHEEEPLPQIDETELPELTVDEEEGKLRL